MLVLVYKCSTCAPCPSSQAATQFAGLVPKLQASCGFQHRHARSWSKVFFVLLPFVQLFRVVRLKSRALSCATPFSPCSTIFSLEPLCADTWSPMRRPGTQYLLTRDCLNLVPGASSWVSVLIWPCPQAVGRCCEGTGVEPLRLLKRQGKTTGEQHSTFTSNKSVRPLSI